jgi:hypothetical protein
VRAGTSSGCGACVWVLVSVTAKTIMVLVRRLALLGSAVLCPGYAGSDSRGYPLCPSRPSVCTHPLCPPRNVVPLQRKAE